MFSGNPMKKNTILFFVFYDSIDTEVITESLMVDFDSLLSTIGGSLGLFLGFSCLSTILSLTSLLKNKFITN